MSYINIDNLYKNQDVLLFKKCYALEKIHGTSAHIGWNGKVYYFSGGEKHERFKALFDEENLIENFQKMNAEKVVIYGEAYGGKCQGMSATYGKDLKFIAFEVKIGDSWLAVPQADSIVRSFNLDFVPYVEIKTDLSELNFWRDAPSQQAVKCGIIEERKREGIVLRPLIEVIKNNGERIISKHKNEAFQETKTRREVTQESLKVLTEAAEIATEWVTPMRLNHVLDKFPEANIEHTGEIIKAMIADIQKESVGEVMLSKEAFKEIGKKTALCFKQYLENKLRER
jgi:YHS domain-containing protein